jgi:hypothetical protein
MVNDSTGIDVLLCYNYCNIATYIIVYLFTPYKIYIRSFKQQLNNQKVNLNNNTNYTVCQTIILNVLYYNNNQEQHRESQGPGRDKLTESCGKESYISDVSK